MDSNTHSARESGGGPDLLVALAAAVDELAGQDLDRVGDAALAEQVLGLRRLLDRLEGHWLQQLATVDGRGAAGADQDQQVGSTAGWLRVRLRLSPGAAASSVRTARALFGGPLPATAQALTGGELSPAHAAVLAHGTHDLPDQLTAAAEPVLVEAARRLDPPRLRRVLAQLRLVADPDGAGALTERRHQQRGLWLAPTLGERRPDQVRLPVPRAHPGLERHRLQLPGRPLRPRVRGPLRRCHPGRARRPRRRVQHQQHRGRPARDLHLGPADRPHAGRPGAAAGLEARPDPCGPARPHRPAQRRRGQHPPPGRAPGGRQHHPRPPLDLLHHLPGQPDDRPAGVHPPGRGQDRATQDLRRLRHQLADQPRARRLRRRARPLQRGRPLAGHGHRVQRARIRSFSGKGSEAKVRWNGRVTAGELAPQGWATITVTAAAGGASARPTTSRVFVNRPVGPSGTSTGGFAVGAWRVSNANAEQLSTSSRVFASYRWGRAGDQPVVGDWDGDGTQTVGVVRPSAARDSNHLLLRNSDGSVLDFWYGHHGDRLVVGDWDGNGTWTPGILRAGTRWYLKDSFTGGAAKVAFKKQTPGRAVVGDWDNRP